VNKLLYSKGPIALLKNEIDNLADMQVEESHYNLQKRCGIVKAALVDLVYHIQSNESEKPTHNSAMVPCSCNLCPAHLTVCNRPFDGELCRAFHRNMAQHQ